MVWLKIIVVLGAVFFGIRFGGIGIGLCGGLGLAILILGFNLQVGSPSIGVILTIMTVVVAASALQVAGGMDYLVHVASSFMRHNPKYINTVVPIVAWSITIMAGTRFIVFSTLPVIAEVVKESGICPSRTLAGSIVTSQVAISGSPISVAVVATLTIMEGSGITFIRVMAVCPPTSFVATMIAAFIVSHQGYELQDDEVYLERLRKGLVRKYEGQNSTTPGAKLSTALFMLATVIIIILTACPRLRSGFDTDNPINTRDVVIIYMLATARLMVVLCKAPAGVIVLTSTFRSGMSLLAAILGIATLGTTFIDTYLAKIKDIADDILQAYPMLLALVLFGTYTLLYSQDATTSLIIPLAVALGVPTRAILASYVAVTGTFVLPTCPTSLAAMEFNTTGTTRVGKCALNHPFMLPGLDGITASVVFGFIITPMVA